MNQPSARKENEEVLRLPGNKCDAIIMLNKNKSVRKGIISNWYPRHSPFEKTRSYPHRFIIMLRKKSISGHLGSFCVMYTKKPGSQVKTIFNTTLYTQQEFLFKLSSNSILYLKRSNFT